MDGVDGKRELLVAEGDLAQMVERSLSMREALGSMPRFSTFSLALESEKVPCAVQSAQFYAWRLL